MIDLKESIKDKLEISVAVISLLSGIASIFKDSKWYIYSPLFLLAIALLIYYFYKQRTHYNFKVSWQEITIDILNKTGDYALYRNTSQLNAVKKNAQKFQYYFSSDGSVENIKTETGSIERIKNESGKINIYTTLERPLNKGEEFKHILTCELKNTFKNESEFWEITRYTPGTKVTINVLFPEERTCKTYQAIQRIGAKIEKCKVQPTLSIIQGRVCLIFKIKQVKLLETFRLEWTW